MIPILNANKSHIFSLEMFLSYPLIDYNIALNFFEMLIILLDELFSANIVCQMCKIEEVQWG